MSNLVKRIFTSILLISLLFTAFNSMYLLTFLLIFIFYQTLYEFYILLRPIYNNNSFKFYLISLLIILILFFSNFFVWLIFKLEISNLKELIYLIILTCVASDIGGFVFGKIFKGKKLTKISPNKTYSGSYGSYLISTLISAIIFHEIYNIYTLLLITFIISTISQLGDLFISFLKRKSQIKDTGTLLPGHGGLLDRIDGLIFAVPLGLLFFGIVWKKKL